MMYWQWMDLPIWGEKREKEAYFITGIFHYPVIATLARNAIGAFRPEKQLQYYSLINAQWVDVLSIESGESIMMECLVNGNPAYIFPHKSYKDELQFRWRIPHCQNCNQPMEQLPDDQIGEGWEYWHCEPCHGGEPFKAGHYDRPA